MPEQNNLSPEDDRLERLQENVKDALGETTFGAPTKITAPGGQTIVYRRRQYDGRPDSSAYSAERQEQRKATPKRSQAMGESWKKFAAGKKAITERSDDSIQSKFPLAHELVEYMSGGGTAGNVARMMDLKPPTIHGIEDVADSVDWHFLNRGINVEHLETALSKDGKQVLVFMDDRAQPRLPQIKEVLSKFGEARILQRADDMSEHTGQPHGFYVFELSPDNALYQPRPNKDPNPKDLTWNPDTPQPNMVDSQEEDDTVEVILEEVFEPFCNTCGDQMFEADQRVAFKPSAKLSDRKYNEGQKRKASTSLWKKTAFAAEDMNDFVEAKKKNNPNTDDDYDDNDGEDEFSDHKSSEAFDAKVGDPKGKKKKDHPSTLGDSLINEKEDDGYAAHRRRKLATRVGGKAATGAVLGTVFGRHGYKSGAKAAAAFGTLGALQHAGSTSQDYDDYNKRSSKAKKSHKRRLGDSLEVACSSCGTDATPLDEHEFQGYYCARHGDRLDKYSRACYECQEDTRVLESVTVACPECHSTCSLEESECGVCGTLFEDGVADYAEHVAESVLPFEVDEDVVLAEHDWSDDFATQLADSLFADIEEDTDPFV